MTHADRIAAARLYYQRNVLERADLETRVAELRTQLQTQAGELTSATESMRTVANLFSASVWRILPDRIKEYFEQYRTV